MIINAIDDAVADRRKLVNDIVITKPKRYGYLLLLALAIKTNNTTNFAPLPSTLVLTTEEIAWLQQFATSSPPPQVIISVSVGEIQVPSPLLVYIPYASVVVAVSEIEAPSAEKQVLYVITDIPVPASLASGALDAEIEQQILGAIPSPPGYTTDADLAPVSIVVALGKACQQRDLNQIQQYLLHRNFLIDDELYQYLLPLPSRPGLVLNASAYILCSAIRGGSVEILKLLLLESRPGASIDPGAMGNLALQITTMADQGREMTQIIGSSVRVFCSRKYIDPNKRYHLYEFSEQELQAYAATGEILTGMSETTETVMKTPEFRDALSKDYAYFQGVLGTDIDLVRPSRLHLSLLLGLRQTRNIPSTSPSSLKAFGQELCLASSLRERQKKTLW